MTNDLVIQIKTKQFDSAEIVVLYSSPVSRETFYWIAQYLMNWFAASAEVRFEEDWSGIQVIMAEVVTLAVIWILDHFQLHQLNRISNTGPAYFYDRKIDFIVQI